MPISVVVIGVVAVVLLIIVSILLRFINLYVRAIISRAPVSMGGLIGMRLRGVPAALIVDTRIAAVKAGIDLPSDLLEAHYLADGNVEKYWPFCVRLVSPADKAGIELDFNRACAKSTSRLLANSEQDQLLEAVTTSINPKVIDCPNPAMGRASIDGVAKDGIGVKVKARVTVRSHLDRFVGGATEETIIARVGEGIVSSIGSSDSYKDVLENPDRISKTVLAKALDSGTAFEIVSIDIADVDVGENIGAKLQAEQADADKRVAQAKAEVRRAAAVAVEQEMRAKTQEMRAKVVDAESQVPLAMAEAFRSGHLGIMDYMRIRNVEADTKDRGNTKSPGPGARSAEDVEIGPRPWGTQSYHHHRDLLITKIVANKPAPRRRRPPRLGAGHAPHGDGGGADAAFHGSSRAATYRRTTGATSAAGGQAAARSTDAGETAGQSATPIAWAFGPARARAAGPARAGAATGHAASNGAVDSRHSINAGTRCLDGSAAASGRIGRKAAEVFMVQKSPAVTSVNTDGRESPGATPRAKRGPQAIVLQKSAGPPSIRQGF